MPRFTPDFLDELKSRIRPSDLVGRYVKLRKQGNEFAGLSPFTKEKTPSFFVNDQKGFYHCFSSGKHGDVIKFLQETQNLSFQEAVEILCEQAGLEVPKDSPQAAAVAQKRAGLAEACDAAAGFFEAMLRRAPGRHASDYLARRGVTTEQIDAFRLGFAPNDRTALKDYLINKGFDEATLVEAGLVIKPDDRAAQSYDRFRNRVMFPILGPRDQVIAFGGRALDKTAKAKYLNSPETPLFHKSDVLYNLAQARSAAAKTRAPLIVCEGYMDVIALWGAGDKRAVAPLGTALTEAQMALLWRVCDEPILCFDGDRAGLGAAYRSIDRALPQLKPGKSLRFALLSDGRDPDDLVREGGRAALDALLAEARPLVDLLWRRELEAGSVETPEQRAGLKAHLRNLVKSIADPDVRAAYGEDFARRLDAMFAPPQRSNPGPGGGPGFQPQRSGKGQWAGRSGGGKGGGRKKGGFGRGFDVADLPASETLKRHGAPSQWRREATLLLAAMNHPSLLDRVEDAFFALQCASGELNRLHHEILSAIAANPGLDSADLKRHLRKTQAADIAERVINDLALNTQSFLRPEAELDEVTWGWSDAHRHHLIATQAREDVTETASQSLTEDGESVWKATVLAREELINAGGDDDGAPSDDGPSARDLIDRLEKMRATVANKGKSR